MFCSVLFLVYVGGVVRLRSVMLCVVCRDVFFWDGRHLDPTSIARSCAPMICADICAPRLWKLRGFVCGQSRNS